MTDEDSKSLAPILYVLLWTLLVVILLAAGYYLLNDKIETGRAIGVSSLPVLLALWLTRRGKIAWGTLILAIGLLGLSAYLMFKGDGSHDTAVLLLPVAIIVPSLLLNKRGVLFISSLSIVALGVVVYGQLIGQVKTLGASPLYLISDVTMAILILIITALAVYLLAAHLRHNLSLARSSAFALTESNRQLQAEMAERQRAQVALLSSEARLSSLLTALPDLILVLGEHGEYLDIFTANHSLLVAPADELRGRIMHDVLPSGLAEPIQQVLDRAVTTRAVQEYEYPLPTPSGKFWFQARVVAYDDPEGLRFLWLARDITEQKQARDAVKQSEEYFRALIEDSSDAIAVLDEHLQNKYRGPGPVRVLGYNADDQMELLDTVHPQDRPAVARALEELARAPGAAAAVRVRLRHRDGSWRWVQVNGKNMIANPAVKGLVFNYHDITERIASEERLQQSERRFRGLIENSLEGITLLSPDGTVIYNTPSVERLLGYPAEERVGRNAFDKIHPEDLPLIKGHIAQEVAVPGSLHGRVVEFRYCRIDGEWRWFEASVKNMLDEPAVHALVVNFRDVTDRKVAEQMLRQGEERYRALFESSLEAIGLSQGNRIVDANDALLALFGYPDKAKVLRVPLLDLVAPESRDRVREFMEKNRENPQGRRFEATVLRTDGASRLLEVSTVPVRIGDQVYTQSTFRDVTELRRAEKEIRKLSRAVEQSPVSIVITDTAGNIEYVNPKFTQITGYSREEVIGGNPRILKSGETKPEEYQRLWQTITAGGEWHGEFHNKKKNGELYWEDAVISPIADDRGTVTHFLAVKEDITERKRSELALKESEERFRMLSEAAFEGIAISEQGILRDVNTRLAEMMGCQVAEMIGKGIADYVAPQAKETVRLHLSAGTETPTQHLSQRKDGSLFPVQVQSRRIPFDGKDLRVTAIRDITESQRAEQRIETQLQRLNALHTIDSAITSFLNLPLILKLFLDQVTLQLGMDAAAVLLLNKITQTLDYASGHGFRTQALQYTHLRVGEGLAGRVALNRHLLHVTNLREEKSEFLRSSPMQAEEFVSYFGIPLIAKGQVQGVLEIFNRQPVELDPEGIAFLETLATQAAIAVDNMTLFDDLQASNLELSLAYDTTLEGWSRALDLRDKETEGHTQRVTELAVRLCRAAGIGEADLVHVRRGALLHDIGKMGIPDSILLKPGPLAPEEWKTMRMHPEFAYRLLSYIAYLRPALDIPYCHHEKWDGTGYPRALKGEEIPLAARIFAVVDVWDALISDRPYRPAWTEPKAHAWIKEQSGTHFDPRIVELFMQMVSDDQTQPGSFAA